MSVSEYVDEFATVTGQEGTKGLYLTLIKEELGEWKDEWSRGSAPEKELKELSDLVYVIYGYARAAGFILIPEPVQNWGATKVIKAVEAWLEEYNCVSSRREINLLDVALGCIYNYADSRQWDLAEAVRRVHKNNLGRCIQPDGTVEYRVDGKILKNDKYPKVYLGDLVKLKG